MPAELRAISYRSNCFACRIESIVFSSGYPAKMKTIIVFALGFILFCCKSTRTNESQNKNDRMIHTSPSEIFKITRCIMQLIYPRQIERVSSLILSRENMSHTVPNWTLSKKPLHTGQSEKLTEVRFVATDELMK